MIKLKKIKFTYTTQTGNGSAQGRTSLLIGRVKTATVGNGDRPRLLLLFMD